MNTLRLTLAAWLALGVMGAAAYAAGPYTKAAWEAHIPLGAHSVRGVATILDERTLQIEHFTYDGTAPAVYFYLGASNSYNAFVNGLQLDPLLDRAYNDEALTLTLPAGETLDDYAAISVWCAAFNVNFSSAAFAAQTPYARAGWVARMPERFHDVYGAARIVNDHLIHVTNFTFDGGGPAVYFYLGATNSDAGFSAGLQLWPHLTMPFSGDALVLTLPADHTLDGYGAISVWCAAFDVNFGSNAFRADGDFDADGDVDGQDFGVAAICLAGPGVQSAPAGTLVEDFAHADADTDRDVDLADWACFSLVYGTAP